MRWQVHRFRDNAGAYIGTGATAYFTADEAENMARALQAVADSIRRESFPKSPPLTVTGDCATGPIRSVAEGY